VQYGQAATFIPFAMGNEQVFQWTAGQQFLNLWQKVPSHIGGSLEQDADIVLFLCRDDFCRETEEDPIRLMELIVAKHRNGPVGKVELFFDHECTKFIGMEKAGA